MNHIDYLSDYLVLFFLEINFSNRKCCLTFSIYSFFLQNKSLFYYYINPNKKAYSWQYFAPLIYLSARQRERKKDNLKNKKTNEELFILGFLFPWNRIWHITILDMHTLLWCLQTEVCHSNIETADHITMLTCCSHTACVFQRSDKDLFNLIYFISCYYLNSIDFSKDLYRHSKKWVLILFIELFFFRSNVLEKLLSGALGDRYIIILYCSITFD